MTDSGIIIYVILVVPISAFLSFPIFWFFHKYLLKKISSISSDTYKLGPLFSNHKIANYIINPSWLVLTFITGVVFLIYAIVITLISGLLSYEGSSYLIGSIGISFCYFILFILLIYDYHVFQVFKNIDIKTEKQVIVGLSYLEPSFWKQYFHLNYDLLVIWPFIWCAVILFCFSLLLVTLPLKLFLLISLSLLLLIGGISLFILFLIIRRANIHIESFLEAKSKSNESVNHEIAKVIESFSYIRNLIEPVFIVSIIISTVLHQSILKEQSYLLEVIFTVGLFYISLWILDLLLKPAYKLKLTNKKEE